MADRPPQFKGFHPAPAKPRPSAAARGYDHGWRVHRDRFLALNPRCQCGAKAQHVDHIIPMAQGGPKWSHSNMQALCASCHGRKTATHDGGFGHAASSPTMTLGTFRRRTAPR